MAQSAWRIPPAESTLTDGVVDVWYVDLSDRDAVAGRLLSEPERERAARFARPDDGARWAVARGTLRALLARHAGGDPRALRLVAGPHGKPELAGEQRLRFNLSHSGEVALYALALERDVGVDVELPRRAIDHVPIARRILGDAEAERLAALDPARREREFLRAWVRWEAALKCHGTGIGGAPAARDVAQPWIRELEMPAPAAAAVAVADGPCVVRCWRWPAAGM